MKPNYHITPTLSAGQPHAVTGTILLFAVFPLLTLPLVISIGVLLLLVTILGWFLHWDIAFPLGIFCLVCVLLTLLGMPSQIWITLALVFYWVTCKTVKWLKDVLEWLKRGEFPGEVLLLTGFTIFASVAALIIWFQATDPDISDIFGTYVPDWNTPTLLLGGVLFSLINAALEEGAYRGVIMHALERAIGFGYSSLFIQAAAFGLLHIHGFPRGWIGVGLAFVFGLLMGIIRRRSGGMLGPWIAHTGVDLVIVCMVVFSM